jgi:hypothetical protein
MVPSIDTVKSMVSSRIGQVSGGRKLRVRALVALVAGLGISVSDALRIYPDDLKALKLPRWAWTPIRQLLRVRDRRWIGRSSPVLCKTRFGSAGQPWDAHEALRAWSYFQRCYCGRVAYTLSGVRRVHGHLPEAEKVRMRPVFSE